MRRRIKVILLAFVLMLVPTLSCLLASAKESDFVVENGILISYNGTDTEVTIPSQVVYIGDNAFRNNTNVQRVVLGDSVRGIGNCAFYGCTSLRYVEQTQSVGAIGAYAFYDTVFLSGKREEFFTINDILVKYCGDSENLVIPSNIRAISPYTFAYDGNITSVEIGDSVEEIGEGAFYMCRNLEKVNIDSEVSVIGGYAFFNTPWLENDSREFLVEGRGILIDSKSTSKNVVIPDDVVTIGTGSFYMDDIESVVFSENTKVIGMRSFMGCESLKEVEIPQGVILIDTQAFYNCNALEAVAISPSVEVINPQAFVNHNRKLVIYGNYGSAAEKYALEYGIPFNTMGTTPGIAGDVDGDGSVSISDATLIQRFVSGMTNQPINTAAADINGDGNINIADVTKLQGIIAGIA